MVLSGLMTTMPWNGSVAEVTVNESPSISLSLAKTSIVTGVSSSVMALSSMATGGALYATISIVRPLPGADLNSTLS